MSTNLPRVVVPTSLQQVQPPLMRCLSSIFLILGTFGNLLNVIILTRRSLRTNSCTMYFLSTTLPNIICLYFGCVSRILDTYSYSPTINPGLYCKFKSYFTFCPLSLSLWLTVLACADRFAASSRSVKLRSFSSNKVPKYTIGATVIVVCLIYLPMFYCFQGTFTGQATVSCPSISPLCLQYNTYILLMAQSILPPVFMLVLSLLTIRNSRLITRRHIVPATTTVFRMKNKDRQLMIMLFIQVSSITLLSLPVSVLRVYSISTMTIVKSIQRQQIEQFLGVLLNVLSLMITGSSFFLFTLTGTIFREELKRLIFKCLPMKYTNNATAVSKTRKQEAT